MISVIILNNGEPKVVQLTFENLYSELKDIYGSELLVKDNWYDLSDVSNRYVCFVEADCLVTPGYFIKQLERFKTKGFSRLTGIMSSSTSVTYWDNRFYGYYTDVGVYGVMPNKRQKSSAPYSVQIAYVPGAILRMSMLEKVIPKMKIKNIDKDLVLLSTELSLAFWKQGYRVNINPKVSYLTTEDYVNDIGSFDPPMTSDLAVLFGRESI